VNAALSDLDEQLLSWLQSDMRCVGVCVSQAVLSWYFYSPCSMLAFIMAPSLKCSLLIADAAPLFVSLLVFFRTRRPMFSFTLSANTERPTVVALVQGRVAGVNYTTVVVVVHNVLSGRAQSRSYPSVCSC